MGTEVFILAAGISALVGGTVIYDELTPKAQLCRWPTPQVRVCEVVKKSELDEKVAEAIEAVRNQTVASR